MKKIILLGLAALMLAPASGQILKTAPTTMLNSPARLVKQMPRVQYQQAQMREPGTAVKRSPRRAGGNEVYYKRPAGAFPGYIAMEPGTCDLLGYYQNTFLQVTPYESYTFKGIANGSFIGTPYFKWEAECYSDSLEMFVWETFGGVQDLTLRFDYPANCPFMPRMYVSDDLDTYTYQWTNDFFGDGASEGELVTWPSWEELVEDESTLLKSSFDFASNRRTDEDDYLFTYFGGMTRVAGAEDGYWFGKNAGYNGIHVDGIAQAFEKPEHPYLLKQVVLYAARVHASEVVDMQCKVYRIDNVPDYLDSACVVLPEEPGELIATGTARLAPNPDNEGDKLIAFTFYKNDEDALPQEVTPTIDEAILVAIDGYNSPEMSALSEFTALASYVHNVDDGMGERAYIKVGKDDAEGNFDGLYQWRGLNNFFSYGEMKTGLSIFLTTDHPFLTSIDTGDDYEYTFPAAGGEMKKTIKDDNGQDVTVDGIKMLSWTPSGETDFGITCDGGELPGWLNISATDGSTDGKFNYHVNVSVTADALPEGMDYREATVRFTIPGNYLDYRFMQSRQGGEDPDSTVLQVTPMPVIEVNEADSVVTIGATGEGIVLLYLDGNLWPENPVRFARQDHNDTIVVTATAKAEGKLISEAARREVVIHALEEDPEPPVATGYALAMNDATVSPGDTVVIPVALTNEGPVLAFQTDVLLPEGYELARTEDGDYILGLGGRAATDHSIMANVTQGGMVRLVCFSPSNGSFAGHEGDLFYLNVVVPADAEGEAAVQLLNTRVTLDNLDEYRVADASAVLTVRPFIPGDVNGNGEVTVTDVVMTVMYALEMDPEPFDFAAGDMNGDGVITVTDVALIVNVVLNPATRMPRNIPRRGARVDGSMSGDAVVIADGETRAVSIKLDNDVDYTALQLDVSLPAGLVASNFAVTDRTGAHTLCTSMLPGGSARVLCYSPSLLAVGAGDGAVLTFDVTRTGPVEGVIAVNGIEVVTPQCQTASLGSFAIAVNDASSMSELSACGRVRVYARGHDIVVESPDARTVTVVDAAGHASRMRVKAGRTVVATGVSGVRIVVVDGQATKLVL